MTAVAYPKKDDPDVLSAKAKHKIAKHLTVGLPREGSNHLDGTAACSVFDAKAPIGKTTVEICRDGTKVTFKVPAVSRQLPQKKLPPRPEKK